MMILTPEADYVFEGRDRVGDPSDDKNLDFKVIKETWVENVYQIHEDDFYDTGVFVDIGANVGSVSLFVDRFNHGRDKDKPKVKVYAVEPEPHNLELLKQNIIRNPTEKIIVVEKAVWYETKKVNISDRGGNSSMIEDSKNGGNSEVQTITLENLFRDYGIKEADVVKIDIEGAEYDLLINTPDDVLKRIKYLTLEFDAETEGKFGVMVQKLAHIFGLQILGSPERGGYIYGRRY